MSENNQEKKKTKKKKHSAGRFIGTFFITLFALCAAGAVFLILTAEQFNLTLPGDWFNFTQTPDQGTGQNQYGLVEESERADDAYFDDAVFIGDSLTHGMTAYPEHLGSIYAVTGIQISTALTSDAYELENGGKGTAVDAAAEQNPGKIYLMFGTNGVNFTTDYTEMIEDYTIMVQHIRQKCPDAIIYIQSIPPVTEGYATYVQTKMTPDHIQEYNSLLLKMAEENQCYFLDTYSVLCTESGYLPQKFTSDSGLHINNDAYDVMFDYIRRHTIKKETE